MAGLGDLIARVGANIDGYMSAMDQVVSKASDTVTATEQRFAAFSNVGQSLAVVGAGLTTAITLPIVGIGTAAMKSFGDFQGAMNRASAQGDIYGADLQKLKDQAIELGAKTQFSATQAADGMAALASAGFKANEIMAAMPGVLNLAAAGQISVGEAAGYTKDILGQFGLEASKTQNTVDVMTKVMTETSASMGELANTFRYVGPVAKSLGLDITQTGAAIIELDKAGIRGEQAGTSLRAMLASLVSPSRKAKEAMDEVGISISDSSGKVRPFSEIMEQFRVGLAKVPGEAEKLALTTQIFGREALSAATVLTTQGGPALLQYESALKNVDGTATRVAGTINSGWNGALERMKGSIDTAGIKIGQILEPALTRVAGVVEMLANKGIELATWFASLPTPVQNISLGFVALAAAAGPILTIIGGIGMAVPAVTAGFAAISTALGAVTLPMTATVLGIAAITAALIALGTWVATNWEPIKATVLQAWDGLTDLWMASWGPIIKNLTTVWTNIANVAESVWGGIVGFFGAIWKPVGGLFEKVWNGISDFLGDVWKGIQKTAAKVWGSIVEVFQEFLKWAQKIPGVNKLMNLDEAWSHAKKLEEQTKKTTTAVKAHGEEHKDAKPKIEGLTTSIGKVTEAHGRHTRALKDHEPEAKKFSASALEHAIKLDTLRTALGRAIAEQLSQTQAYMAGLGPVQAMAHALDGVAVSIKTLIPQHEALSNVIKAGAVDADTAARKAGDAIKQQEKDTKAATDGMTVAHKTHGAEVRSVWGQIQDEIGRATATFGRSVTDAFGDILHGEFSISKLGDAFKKLGLDIVDVFMNKAANAITSFVMDHIGSLLGALGKLLEKIPLIGDALGAIFGGFGGGGGASLPPGTIPTGGGGGGGGGGGFGTMGGATALGAMLGGPIGAAIGAVIDVGTAVWGLVGDARREGSLNAIEHNTRYSMMYLGEHGGTSIMDILFKIQELVWYGPLVKAVESIRDSMFMQYALPNLDSIKDSAYWTLQKVDEIRQMMTEPLAFGGGAVASGAGGIAVHIDLRGSTISSDAAARDLADRVAASVTDRLQKELR